VTLHDDDSSGVAHPPASGEADMDGSTGLPWPRTWPGLYLFVIGCFALWVVLLVLLERSFS
jgi:hypothetical protein